MNKNKKNKLTIKSNWDKNLTISPLQMNRIIGGDGDRITGSPAECLGGCEVAATKTDNTKNPAFCPGTDPDN